MAQDANQEKIYSLKYRLRWESQMQAIGNKFRAFVDVDNEANGNLYRIPFMGSRSMSPIVSDDNDTPNNGQSVDVRWMAPEGYEDGIILPKNLSLYSANGEAFASRVMEQQGKAAGRCADDVIIKAALGKVRVGETGTDLLALPSKNIISAAFDLEGAAAGDKSMTLSKALRVKTLLMESDAYQAGDKLVFAVSPRCLENMLLDPRFTSADYGMIRSLISGEIKEFLGFDWLVTNQLPVKDGLRQCAAWTKRAMTLGVWKDYSVECSKRADKKNRDQIYVSCHLSAARLHDAGVYRVDCKEAN